MSDKVIKAQNVHLVGNVLTGDAALQETAAEKAEHERKQSYDQGFAAGAAMQKDKGAATLKSLSQLLREAGDVKKKMLADAEDQMVKLALAVAEKVIYDEVSANPQIIQRVLREAVKGVLDREGMKIHLNPQDLQSLREMKPDFMQEFSGMKNVAFEEDRSIQRGGALLETLAGEVDARLEQRLAEVKAALQIK